MGLLHGAAGTAAFVGETLVAFSQSYATLFAYTVAFGLGVLLAMVAYGVVFGGVLSWGERRSQAIILGARVLTALCACMVGIWWVLK